MPPWTDTRPLPRGEVVCSLCAEGAHLSRRRAGGNAARLRIGKEGKPMQFFGSKVPGRTYLLVFDRGELLLEGIQEMVRKEGIESAVITGGIGSLTELKCHAIAGTGLPATDAPMHAVGPIELSS